MMARRTVRGGGRNASVLLLLPLLLLVVAAAPAAVTASAFPPNRATAAVGAGAGAAAFVLSPSGKPPVVITSSSSSKRIRSTNVVDASTSRTSKLGREHAITRTTARGASATPATVLRGVGSSSSWGLARGTLIMGNSTWNSSTSMMSMSMSSSMSWNNNTSCRRSSSSHSRMSRNRSSTRSYGTSSSRSGAGAYSSFFSARVATRMYAELAGASARAGGAAEVGTGEDAAAAVETVGDVDVSSPSIVAERQAQGDNDDDNSLSRFASEGAPSKSKRRRGGGGSKPKPLGPRKTGDLEKEGFSGTRRGFHVLKVYDVPDEAPTDLPEGEDEGYPMLIYQFMHAQYREEFPSQSSARKSVRRKELLLNGEEVRNDVKVKPGDTVTMQKRVQPGLFPQGKPTCTLPVLWEDDFMAVIIKPPGVAVHGGTGADDPGPGGRRSVRQALPYMLQPTKSTDRPLHRPLHCHRLDKPTGGLLICAKTRPALSALSDAFERRLVSKRYVALVAGELEGSGAIVTPLDGKASQTNYRVRGDPVRSLKTPVINTVDLWPVSGRFHQLRRHLASIDCPIVGDKRYTPDHLRAQEGSMFLYAIGLTFPHPITGEELNFSIPEPAKFEKWRQKEEQRWLEHHDDHDATGEIGATDDATSSEERGGVSTDEGDDQEKRPFNPVPDVKGLQVEDRDGFRYYQYDWSVVGGPPTALSLDDIDETVEAP